MRKKIDESEISEIIEEYKYSDCSMEYMCEKHNISQTRIYNILKSRNIPTGRLVNPRKKWTNEMIIEQAKKYKHRSDWQNAGRTDGDTSYTLARTRGIFEECCKHMVPKPNCFTADIGIIYGFFFADNHCYVGLTVNPSTRYEKHMREGPVFKHIKKCPKFEYKVLEKDVAFSDIVEREQHYMDMYTESGFNILNTKKARSTGSITSRYWTDELLQKDALLFKSRTEWARNKPASYSIAVKRKKVDKFCSHMEILKRAPWSEEEVMEDAKKYNTRAEWSKLGATSYMAAIKLDILDKSCEHMKYVNHIWTDDMIMESSKKYNTITEWSASDPKAYQAHFRRSDRQRFTHHMDKSRYNNWSDDELIYSALKYETRSDWINCARKEYMAAHRKNILHKCIHSTPHIKHKHYTK